MHKGKAERITKIVNKKYDLDLSGANKKISNPLIQEWYISSFADKQNLKKHVEAVHEGIKPFKCSICDLKFANNYNPLIQE